MYSLSIHFGPSPVPAQFLFKDKDKAVSSYGHATTDGEFHIEDDFGQRGYFKSADVHAAIIEDLELGEEARIQRGLSNARGQAKANERARTDPILMRAAAQSRSPSMLTPFGTNGFSG